MTDTEKAAYWQFVSAIRNKNMNFFQGEGISVREGYVEYSTTIDFTRVHVLWEGGMTIKVDGRPAQSLTFSEMLKIRRIYKKLLG